MGVTVTRLEIMARIRGKDTGPELVARRLVGGMGYRCRLHRRDLPGSPGLALTPHRKVILVHGCFWHRHACKRGRSMPATRVGFWARRFEANRLRDRALAKALKARGWKALVVWECETTPARREQLADILRRFLETE